MAVWCPSMALTLRWGVARWLVMTLAALTLVGCGDDGGAPEPAGDGGGVPTPSGAGGELTLQSAAFADGETIPERHTCDGEDVSPPLAWDGVPDDAAALALVVTDPDAPDGPFVHWVVAGLDPAADGVDAGTLPAEAVEGTNDFGERAYGGPCPPSGDPAHEYVFTLYAADDPLPVERGATADEVEAALADRVLASGELTGTYSR